MGPDRLRLPRQLPDRILVGCLAVPIAALSGMGLFLMFAKSRTPNTSQLLLHHLIMSELLGTVFILSAGALLWVTTQPTWLERLLGRTAGRALLLWVGVFTGLIVWGVYVLISSR